MTTETENVTFRELADRRGCRLDTARALVRRHHWRKIKGNDNVVRIQVPVDFLLPVEPGLEKDGDPDGDHHPLLERLVDAESKAAAALATVTELRASLAREQQLNDQLREELKDLRRPWWSRWWKTG